LPLIRLQQRELRSLNRTHLSRIHRLRIELRQQLKIKTDLHLSNNNKDGPLPNKRGQTSHNKLGPTHNRNKKSRHHSASK
jgi:hypothetical protein